MAGLPRLKPPDMSPDRRKAGHGPVAQSDDRLRATGEKDDNRVCIHPKQLDEKVGRLHLENLENVGARLTEPKPAQSDYIGVNP